MGAVCDASGAVFLWATVRATNIATKLSKDETTNQDGVYRAGALAAGTYAVVMEKSGSSRVENKELVVNTQPMSRLMFKKPSVTYQP